MLNIHTVTEGQCADESRGHVRAQSMLLCDQLLQPLDRERVLGAYIHSSCKVMDSEHIILQDSNRMSCNLKFHSFMANRVTSQNFYKCLLGV